MGVSRGHANGGSVFRPNSWSSRLISAKFANEGFITMRSFGLILALAAMLLTNSADAGHKCCKPAKCKPVKCKVVKCCKPAKVKCCKPEPTCCSAAPACEVAPTCCASAPSCSSCGTSACGAGGCAVAAPAVMATEAAAPVAPAVEEAPAPPAEPAPAK